jgi:hypothetical protein
MHVVSSQLLVLGCLLFSAEGLSAAEGTAAMRPPAVPLVVCDPYFSVWSPSDRLTDSMTMHWTGKPQALSSMIRVDGQTWRLMGLRRDLRVDVPNAVQKGMQVLPTCTEYLFEAGGVEIVMTFRTPMLPDDLDVLSWPVTYLNWDVRSGDGKPHEVSLYFDASAELAVNKPDQKVACERGETRGPQKLATLRVGTVEQSVLGKDGDDLRIDWGYFYLAVPQGEGAATAMGRERRMSGAFAKDGTLPGDDPQKPTAVEGDWPVLACRFDLGRIEPHTKQDGQFVGRHVILAYDDIYSIEYLGTKLRPYWRRNRADAAELLQEAESRLPELVTRAHAFDTTLMSDCRRVGGERYAQLCALAYREAIGGNKLAAGPAGEPMLFPKECSSNGCISTVDVIYPAAPIFMCLSNDLLKALVRPVLDYAAGGRWRFPFAPHDLGRYPKADGQVYGGGEKTEDRQMPVEECGNMLIVAAAVAKIDGNTNFLKPYWTQLQQWAEYLKEKGLDPENQLCTDDFAGHLAHNVNLSVKAIEGLGAYAMMAEMAGRHDEAAAYRHTAESFARQWVTMADDGDHFRLAFDLPGTWSQKYNLVWDRLLELKLFPAEVARKEIAFYLRKLNRFGVPLDNRSLYTKTDWEVWTATLAENRADFDALMEPVFAFVSHTSQRVPLTDWYWTHDAARKGFQARPVIGGVFIKLLSDPTEWAKWPPTGKPAAQ